MAMCSRLGRTIRNFQYFGSSHIINVHHSKSCVKFTLPLPIFFGHQRAQLSSFKNFLKNDFAKVTSCGHINRQATISHNNFSTDKILAENNETQVYYGNLTSQIRIVKVFSLITSVTGLAAQPFFIQKASELDSLGLGIALGSFVGFFTFVTPFLLHWITKKYVTQLTYNSQTDEYTADTITFFLGNRKNIFKVSDITIPEVSGMFTTFTVNKKTALFVDPRLFNDPKHYAKMMGYDKPLDFKLESDSKS